MPLPMRKPRHGEIVRRFRLMVRQAIKESTKIRRRGLEDHQGEAAVAEDPLVSAFAALRQAGANSGLSDEEMDKAFEKETCRLG